MLKYLPIAVTYINTTDRTGFAVDGTSYTIDAKTVLKDTNGNVLAMGLDVAAKLNIGDKVEVKDNVITVEVTSAAKELSDAVKAAQTALTAHITAGGKATDAEYIAVDAALKADPQVTATIKSTTTTLAAATKVLTDAAKAEADAVAEINAVSDKFEMRTAVNSNLADLGISSAITLEAADYLFTKLPVGGYADAAAIIAELAAFAAL